MVPDARVWFHIVQKGADAQDIFSDPSHRAVYTDLVVEAFERFRTRYIHRNPLPIVGSAGLVGYRWSSVGVLCGTRPAPDWLATGVVSAGFDAASYERYVMTPQPCDRIGQGDLPPTASHSLTATG